MPGAPGQSPARCLRPALPWEGPVLHPSFEGHRKHPEKQLTHPAGTGGSVGCPPGDSRPILVPSTPSQVWGTAQDPRESRARSEQHLQPGPSPALRVGHQGLSCSRDSRVCSYLLVPADPSHVHTCNLLMQLALDTSIC